MSNDKFELLDGSCSVSDIQNNFNYITKRHETLSENPAKKMYINKNENRFRFKIKSVFYLELLLLETVKLLRSTESKITKDKNGTNVPNLGITEVMLVHCSIVNNSYQQSSTFVPNKSFGQWLELSSTNFIFLRTFSSEFSDTEV